VTQRLSSSPAGQRRPLNRNYFNRYIWKPSLVRAGVDPTRDNGLHALRHYYASVLLDAGESIRTVAEYLGHSDPGFTLRTYTHLIPASEARARKAVDGILGSIGVTEVSGTAGTAVPALFIGSSA
jgi:integrase